jgi:hypothetical protein
MQEVPVDFLKKNLDRLCTILDYSDLYYDIQATIKQNKII